MRGLTRAWAWFFPNSLSGMVAGSDVFSPALPVLWPCLMR